MSPVVDPLTLGCSPDRVAYRLGVMLHAEDFLDEQTYHRGRLARALSFLHGTGTAAGLGVVIEGVPSNPADPSVEPAEPESVHVAAGIAIDGLGRMIEVPRAACLRIQRWFDALPSDELAAAALGSGQIRADVFLRFAACPRGYSPAFAAGAEAALDATAPSRIRDGYELQLALRTEATPLLPRDPFADLRSAPAAERRARLEQLLLEAWDTAQEEDSSVPATLDRSLYWVFLARIVIPVDTTGARPTRTSGPCTVDSGAHRLLVCPTAALGSLLGL